MSALVGIYPVHGVEDVNRPVEVLQLETGKK